MSNAITPFVPQNLEQASALSKQLATSALLPDSLRGKPGDVLVVLITGSELGLSPMQAIRGLHVIKGKAVMSADLQVALTKRHPECEFFRLVDSTPTKATYETQRKGEPKPTSMTWTTEDANRAGLAGDNWRKYPAAMLRARCASALARAVFPDLMLGVYEEDEAKAFGHKPEQALNPEPAAEPIRELTVEPVVEGQIIAPVEQAAKEVRAPSGKVAAAKAKAQESLKRAAPKQEDLGVGEGEIITPYARMAALGRLHGLSTAQIFVRAQKECEKSSGWTLDDVEKVAASLAAVPAGTR